MSHEQTLAPATYARWRATTLGRITEDLEVALVFELAGDLAGKRVLDVGTGDGTYAVAAAERGALPRSFPSNPSERHTWQSSRM